MLLRLGLIVVIVIVIRVKHALSIRAEQQDKGDRQDQLCQFHF
jgi:hypothetical protein